ncbi:fungal-specific transcription factor domain-containing protein [Geopyxis carbonaria]|nr:fungal-specific transcription factor domain-containing protein [Geopyxis carbonaria]
MPEAMTVQATAPAAQAAPKKGPLAQDRKYKCAYCNRAFSRSEHRSRHERSHTKERPFKCLKCRSTFVRRDLLLRHDRTVHAKDGGIPLHSEVKRRGSKKNPATVARRPVAIEPATLRHIESASENLVDLETAAVLMTELHHAAAAAMVDHERETLLQDKSRRSMSSGPEFDPSVPFPSGAIPVQNMSTWDPPTPCSSTGPDFPKVNTMSSSQDWNANTLQLPGHPISMERSFSAEPTPISHRGSPNPFFPGPPSPSGLPASSQASPPPTPPSVQSDHERNLILDNIREIDVERAVLDRFRLPSKSALNRYLTAYFNLFHHHLPFLHTASFQPGTVAPPLLLAILSVGALYTFEKEQAYTLHLSSKVLVNNFLHRTQDKDSHSCPLWATQTLLLNMVFASWSGDSKGVEWAYTIKVLLANMVIGGRYELETRIQQRGVDEPSREEWVMEEGCRRTYYAVYIFFGLLTLIYNHTPPLQFNEFDQMSLPCSETLWNLEVHDDQTWRDAIANEATPTFARAHSQLYDGDHPQYSAFAARIMINALFIEVWSVKRSPEAPEVTLNEYKEKLSVALDTWHKALDFCTPESMIVPLTAPQKGHPLVFNALAMYRCTVVRLEVDLVAIQEAIRFHVPEEIAAAMTPASELIHRSESMTKVIQLCFECFQIPALMGIRWVARTSALNWSVEHPLCGLDLMLILSLWLQKFEDEVLESPATEEEQAMLNKIRSLFDDDSTELSGSKLSAAVARVWGGMIDEVNVWGITRILGESFKLHAHILSLNDDSGMTLSSSSSSPSPETDEDMDSEME